MLLYNIILIAFCIFGVSAKTKSVTRTELRSYLEHYLNDIELTTRSSVDYTASHEGDIDIIRDQIINAPNNIIDNMMEEKFTVQINDKNGKQLVKFTLNKI